MWNRLGVAKCCLGLLWGLCVVLGPVSGQGQTPAGVTSYSFLAGDEGWTTGGAPLFFPPPGFDAPFNQLTLQITEFLNFGFWQSPAGAIPAADGDSLYAVRALLSTGIPACDVPAVRVRALAQGLAQSSVLYVNSSGDCSAVPGAAPALFTSFFQPQGAAAGDDFIVAVDLLNFDPFDASSGDIVIDHVDILRLPLSELTNAQSLRTYTFEADEEGWSSGSVPSFFTPPVFEYTGSALSITSQNNIGTFGFWNNVPADFSLAADTLYRARFDWASSSNTPLSPQTAIVRTRLFSSDNQYSQTTEHTLPNLGAGEYHAFFMPPVSLVGSGQDGLGVAVDLTNFNPEAPTEVTVEIDEVEVLAYDFPSGFKAVPFVPTDDTTLPEGDYEFSEIIIPDGVEVIVEGDVKITVLGDVDIDGLLVGDCARIEIYAEGDVTITGTVANTCSTTPTLGSDIIIHTNGGNLMIGTEGNPAEILSDGDVDITNDPTIADWQFEVPEGAESLVPLPPVAAALASTLYDAATTTFTTEVQFTGFGADPDGGPVTYFWEFGDGGTSTEQNPIHEYSAPGKHVVTLTVTDDENDTAQATLTIVLSEDGPDDIPTDPGVQLDPYFIVLEVGEEALFTAEAFDPDGQDLAYELTLGDLTTSNDEITTHVYLLPGRYELSLTVTDTSGTTSMATASVYVHAPLLAPPLSEGAPDTEPQIVFNFSTEPVKAIGPNAPIISRRQIPPPHPKAPIGQSGKNMSLRGRGNAIVPAGSLIRAGDGGDGRNRSGQYVTAGNGRVGGSTRILVSGSLTVFGGTTIAAGNGGNGGRATATAPVNSNGSARGGNGGDAGRYVWLQASRGVTFAGPGVTTIDPGSGGAGGIGECFGADGALQCPRGDNGGRTWARGGNGGHASKTVIVRGNVNGLNFVTLVGGNGGDGAIGDADSGDGGTAAVCDPAAFGGHGGAAISYGGRGGNGRLTGAFAAIGVIDPGAFIGGDGGDGFSDGGNGGDAEAESDCVLARAVAGRGGQATASGGKGGRGFNGDGNGGNGDADAGDGGNAIATGTQCGDDGNDASATGGNGGSARANRGEKGGRTGADGTATANGGWGGDATATGGPGKDKEDAPGGKGGNATATGGDGSSANASRGVSFGGDGGDATANSGRGGNSTSSPPDPCEDKTGLLGGPGGAASATGGRGGSAGGFQALDFDGDGGDADATGGAGGDALATGGDCDTCGNKGGDAEATGGPGGQATANKGRKGGSNGTDGTAESNGGPGGNATAMGGKGGDCDDGSTGGPGGAATATGGTGGSGAGNDSVNGGNGGDANTIGGAGGFSTNPEPGACQSQTAEGGPGGTASSTAGDGGPATGVNATSKTDGDGGNANATGGAGGPAVANGGDCFGCDAKGGNADSTGGPGGPSDAIKGKKGGPNGSDGIANSTGGVGGSATANGGRGGDCDQCPAGKGGPGGDVTGVGGDGGDATGDDVATGGFSGIITINGGIGGNGASCCETKPTQPGGDGGAGGNATATPGTPGTPGGPNGSVGVKAGNGGNGGDGDGPGAGGPAGVGVNVPNGIPGAPGNPCPRKVITPSHGSLPATPDKNTTYTLEGIGPDGETYSPIGCIFIAPPSGDLNQPSYSRDEALEIVILSPGVINPEEVPAAVLYDIGALDGVSVIGMVLHAQTGFIGGFPGESIVITGFVDDVPVMQGFNLPTTDQSVDVELPPPPAPGTAYNKILVQVYIIPVHFDQSTGVELIDP